MSTSASERYEIREALAQGGVGEVYRAFDKSLQREVALKRLKPPKLDDFIEAGGVQISAPDDLLQEARTLSSLQHPHIVTIYDMGVDDDGP